MFACPASATWHCASRPGLLTSAPHAGPPPWPHRQGQGAWCLRKFLFLARRHAKKVTFSAPRTRYILPEACAVLASRHFAACASLGCIFVQEPRAFLEWLPPASAWDAIECAASIVPPVPQIWFGNASVQLRWQLVLQHHQHPFQLVMERRATKPHRVDTPTLVVGNRARIVVGQTMEIRAQATGRDDAWSCINLYEDGSLYEFAPKARKKRVRVLWFAISRGLSCIELGSCFGYGNSASFSGWWSVGFGVRSWGRSVLCAPCGFSVSDVEEGRWLSSASWYSGAWRRVSVCCVGHGVRGEVSLFWCLVAGPCCGSCGLRVVLSGFALFVSSFGAFGPLLVDAVGGFMTRIL